LNEQKRRTSETYLDIDRLIKTVTEIVAGGMNFCKEDTGTLPPSLECPTESRIRKPRHR
jgi:hypothetical protein